MSGLDSAGCMCASVIAGASMFVDCWRAYTDFEVGAQVSGHDAGRVVVNGVKTRVYVSNGQRHLAIQGPVPAGSTRTSPYDIQGRAAIIDIVVQPCSVPYATLYSRSLVSIYRYE